jgi:hypothetical protein
LRKHSIFIPAKRRKRSYIHNSISIVKLGTLLGMRSFIIALRGSSLDIEQLAQIFGGLLMGFTLDTPLLPRSKRARVGWAMTFALTMIIYGGGYAFQKWANAQHKSGRLDFDAGRVCKCIKYSMVTVKRPKHSFVKLSDPASSISSTDSMMRSFRACATG